MYPSNEPLSDSALPTAPARACRHCNAPLGDLGEQDCCPVCGLPVLASNPAGGLVVAVDEHGAVAGDTECHKCGYNLRGLPRDGLCPECATAIGVSICSDLLCFAEPAYVRRLARGNRWVVAGLNIIAASLIAGILAGITTLLELAEAIMSVLAMISGPLVVLGVIAGGLVFLVGLWLVTTPEARVFDTRGRDAAGRSARLYLAVAALGGGLVVAVNPLTLPVWVAPVIPLVGVLSGVAIVAGVWFYFRYLRGVVERVPSRAMAQAAKKIGSGLATALGAIVFFSAVNTVVFWWPTLLGSGSPPAPGGVATGTGLLSGTSLGTSLHVVQGCVTLVAGLAALIYFLGAVRLHTRLRTPLDQQAVLAESHWNVARHPPGG